MTCFRDWFLQNEIALGSDGNRDNQVTQTNQATTQVAQKFLASPDSAATQSRVTAPGTNQAAKTRGLLDAGTQAIQQAPAGLAAKTTAPAVANFIGGQFNVPKVAVPAAPSFSMMRKK